MFHSFGLTAGVVVPLIHGTRLMLYPSPLHYRTIPEVVYDRDCTVLFSTNTFLANYVKAAHPYDFYSLRYVIVGAEKLTEDVSRLCFEKLGLRPFEGYGATECSPVISANTPFCDADGNRGRADAGHRAPTRTGRGNRRGRRTHVRGDNVMLGYLKPKSPGTVEPPSSIFGPGWYNTGDVVTMDDDFVTLTARMKRFAKVAGEMVSLEVVERIAAEAKPHGVHALASIGFGSRRNDRTLYRGPNTAARGSAGGRASYGRPGDCRSEAHRAAR